jgi:hypothetical protein
MDIGTATAVAAGSVAFLIQFILVWLGYGW